jgi:type II secretory pathway pseudopilin PulG
MMRTILLAWWSRIEPRRGAGQVRGQAGTALIESLVAIFVMGVGLTSLLTLFPLGVLSMRQATAESRAEASVEALSSAVAAHAQYHGVLPASLSQLTPFLGGDDRYENGADAGYLFSLRGDGSVSAEPAAPGKTGVHRFCKALAQPLEDCTSARALARAREAQQLLRENLLAWTAEVSVDLLLEDPTGQAIPSVRSFISQQSIARGFRQLDADGDGQVSFRELLGSAPTDPVLGRYYAVVAAELELGAGDEDVDALPPVPLAGFVGDPGVVFTFDTLRFLVKRYAAEPRVARILTRRLDAAEAAAASGDEDGKVRLLRAFANRVRAEAGTTLTAQEVRVLTTLALTL